jgi:hypothetical protein
MPGSAMILSRRFCAFLVPERLWRATGGGNPTSDRNHIRLDCSRERPKIDEGTVLLAAKPASSSSRIPLAITSR